jgi:tRNA A37 methylthiotransferase MiaB
MTQCDSLASALIIAWRKHHKAGFINEIAYQHEIILNKQELAEAFREMDSLAKEQLHLPLYEISELVLQKMQRSTSAPPRRSEIRKIIGNK